MTHAERMAKRKAERSNRKVGFESLMPTALAAKGWHNLNRKFRRSYIARMQASKDGKPRLSRHAAQVAFMRGVEKHGV